MNTFTANDNLTYAASDFWTDFIARIETWLENTPAVTAGVPPSAAEVKANEVATRRYWREMRMLETCQ